MSRPNAIYFTDSGHAVIALPDGEVLTTCALHADRYVRIDDGNQYPQLCVGGQRTGATIVYSGRHPSSTDGRLALARDCNARMYKTRAGFDRAARQRRRDSWPR
jgi:hypothetical protein